MVLEKVKLYLDGTMLRFESDDEDFRTRSTPTGRVEAAFQGEGFTFTDVVQETLICSVDSFDDVLDAAGATYGATQEDVAVALNVFLNFKAGSGSTDYVELVALNAGSLDFTGIGAAFSGSVDLTGLDSNFANTDLTLDDNRSHDFDGKYMLLNSTGFTSPVSTEPAFILDPLGGLFGTPIVGIKNGILSGINTTLLQQDDGSGLKTAISTQDSVGDVHRLEVNQGSVVISSTNGGDGNIISNDKNDGIEIQVESGNLSIDIPSADAVGKVLTLNNAVTKEVEFTDISGLGNNIYNADGALTGDREVDIDGNELSFTNFQLLEISSGVNLEIQSQQASIEIDEDLEVSTQDTTLNSDNLDIITDIFRLNIPSADAVGKVLTVANSTSKEVEFTDISSAGLLSAPNVSDEDDRDTTYPSPSDGQRVFNLRTQEIETYNNTVGLWLSPTKKIAIRDTALLVDRFAYVSSFFTVSLESYPVLSYPVTGAQDNQTFGVIVQIGNSIDVARDFVAIAVGNQQFVDFGEAIAVGEYVSAKLTAPNGGQGFAAGNAATTGRAGIAVQNSGATLGKPTKVLVQLNLLAETF